MSPIKNKDKAIKRISRVVRRYYFDVLDENTLRLKDGTIYHWAKSKENLPNLTLLEAVKKLTEGIARYVVERTNPMEWKRAEKLFHGYNFPYKPGIGLLATAFPEGLIQIIGDFVIPTPDIMSFLKKFYLSTSLDRAERRYCLKLIEKIEKSKVD